MSSFPNLWAGLPNNSYTDLITDDSTSWVQKAALVHSATLELDAFNAGFGNAMPGGVTGGEPHGLPRLSFLA